jgi:hypothetical protein
MTAVAMIECTCPQVPIFCARCGGLLHQSAEPISGLLSKMEGENLAWMAELESEGRLNSTLATFRAIDRQYKVGAPVAIAVSKAMKEICSDISEMKNEVVKDIVDRFCQMQTQNQSEAGQLREVVREIVAQQTQDVMNQVKLLQEQGKSVAEIHGLLKETVGSIQTVMTAFQVPAIKGEEAELLSTKNLQEAFFGVSGIKIEPVGGSDATDGLVRFAQNEVEIGRALVEVKSRKSWSNAFIDQVRSDMKRYNAPLAVIVADKLPRNARGKGFAIDSQVGLIIVTTQDLLIPTVSMFYEIHLLTFKIQQKTLDLGSLAADRDLVHYINDNMNCLDNCKQIVDSAKDSAAKIERLALAISARLHTNNRKIAQILDKLNRRCCEGMSVQEENG